MVICVQDLLLQVILMK